MAPHVHEEKITGARRPDSAQGKVGDRIETALREELTLSLPTGKCPIGQARLHLVTASGYPVARLVKGLKRQA